jgi:general secretion pathway protein K
VRTQEKGIALIMTLWVLVLLTAVAMSFTFSSRRGSASTRNLKEDTQAYYLSLSAYEEVIAYLLADQDPTVDFIDEQGNFRTDLQRPAFTTPSIEGAEVEVRLTDEESRLNINTLDNEQLDRLFEEIGVTVEERQPLVDALLDWRDPDDEHHLSGAEDEYYEAFGYNTKDKPLDMPEELLLVKGFTPGHMYGGDDFKPLERLITTYSSGVNVNTVPEEALHILGLDDRSISTLLTHRTAPGGTQMIPSQMAAFGKTASSHFRIQVVSRMTGNPLAVRITSVVRRDFGPQGPVMTTIYWKEDIESSRT